MNERVKAYEDLKSACVSEALDIIRDVGIEDLSLREVARRLGVSHQAPYRHFRSRDYLLADVVDRCFRDFDADLAEVPHSEDPRGDLSRLGRRYLAYAAAKPLEYRLMFGARLPKPEDHPGMLERGCGAFDQLRAVLSRILGDTPDSDRVGAEAIFVWSTIHGLASILQTEAMAELGLPEEVQGRVAEHVLARIDAALPTG